jgi:hypothetical protein
MTTVEREGISMGSIDNKKEDQKGTRQDSGKGFGGESMWILTTREGR